MTDSHNIRSSDRWPSRIQSLFFIEERPEGRVLWPLFLVSFSSLCLEILLIRWIGTEVRVFAYFQNLALIACFLGFGLGCYRASERKSHLFEATAAALLVILAGFPMAAWRRFLETLSSGLAISPDAAIWSGNFGLGPTHLARLFVMSALAVTALLVLVVATMVPLGQWVGHYLNSSENVVSAYSVNLLGSLAGIWLFAGMSVLRLSPLYWFGIAFLGYLLLRNPARKFDLLTLLLMMISVVSLYDVAFRGRWKEWSPYQKLEVEALGDHQYNVSVNNAGYMTIANLSPDYLAMHPSLAKDYQRSSYDAPFRLVGSRDHLLIVGAGAGNDAAAALRNGAREVDAIEIDPVIYSLGIRLHPDHPYDSAHVHVILEDARSYLRRSTQRYDVIIFGLLDSHTQFSGYSNMRIDNYVYTQQSFAEARKLLNPSGVLIVKFEVLAPWTWMGQRFYSMFDHLFGRPPIVFSAPAVGALLSATEFIAFNDEHSWSVARKPEIAKMIQEDPPQFPLSLDGAPPPVTDDWPYVYHRSHTVPRTYLTVSLILMSIALLATRRSFEPQKVSSWYFFFLGAGFLLLETQMISRLALYFGSTWWVNCVVLSAVLVVLILSNLFVQRAPERALTAPYVLLVSSLLTIYLVRLDSLHFSARFIGMMLAAEYCVPLFLAGVIFAETFRRLENKSTAFGSNIIGAVAGGIAQNFSFVIGLKALLLLAAVFYTFAGVFTDLGLRSVRTGEPDSLAVRPTE